MNYTGKKHYHCNFATKHQALIFLKQMDSHFLRIMLSILVVQPTRVQLEASVSNSIKKTLIELI